MFRLIYIAIIKTKMKYSQLHVFEISTLTGVLLYKNTQQYAALGIKFNKNIKYIANCNISD